MAMLLSIWIVVFAFKKRGAFYFFGEPMRKRSGVAWVRYNELEDRATLGFAPDSSSIDLC